MNIQSIIVQAACNAAIVPSFNQNELPADVEANAYTILADQLLPQMNTDRALDVSLIQRVETPIKSEIELHIKRLPPNPIPPYNITNLVYDMIGDYTVTDYRLMGTLPFTLDDFRLPGGLLRINDQDWPNLADAISALTGMPNANINTIPYLDFLHFKFVTAGVDRWFDGPVFSVLTKDGYLLFLYVGIISGPTRIWIAYPPYKITGNMDWMPARIDRVLEVETGIPYTYIYPTDFYSVDYKFHPFIYTTEMGNDYLKIMFRHSNTPKRLMIPQPLYIDNDQLIAPPKFKLFIIDALATRLAIHYGMSTVPAMEAAAEKSYKMLLKQQPVQVQPINIRMKIRDTMKSSAAKYWRFDGFV